MKEVKVDKVQLLSILDKNKKQHVADYEKALAGYWEEVVEQHENALKCAKNKEKVPYISLTKPVCNADDYDKAIGMLEMHVEATVTLSSEDYSNFINDDWTWKSQWVHSNTMYMNKVK